MHDNLGKPKLEPFGASRWRLLEPFEYVTAAGRRIVIPKGFITDGASSPLRVLIRPLGGHYPVAALVHDWLYWCLNMGKPDPAAPTRKAADAIFREVMRRSGVRPLVRFGMWLAVRAFGANPLLKRLAVR
jgi:hypothetical protein